MVIDGKIERLFFAGENTAAGVLRLEDPQEFADGFHMSVRFFANIFEAKVGQKLSLVGEYIKDPKWGYQFQGAVAKISYNNPASIKKLLESGFIKGIGPALAARITDKFGDDVKDIIEFHWMKLAEVPGISVTKAEEIHKAFTKSNKYFDIVSIFNGDVTMKQVLAIYEAFPENAVEIIKKNPYKLLKIDGFGFKKVDLLARKSGIPNDDPRRVSAAIVYTMKLISDEGHCYYDIDLLGSKVQEMVEKIDVPDEMFIDCVSKLISSKELTVVDENKIYLTYLLDAEQSCAAFVKKKIAERSELYDSYLIEDALNTTEDNLGIGLEGKQRTAVHECIRHQFSIITGGPGTGKTTVVNALINAFKACGGEKIILCAPTGRASRRMKEATGLPAQTLHRFFMNVEDKAIIARATGGKGVEDLPYYCKDGYSLFVIDEASMIDLTVASRTFKAISQLDEGKVHVVMIGDIDQLPPIGAGNIFRDLVNSPLVPTVKLEYSHRFAGSIAKNADTIKKGNKMQLFDYDDDFVFAEEERDVTRDKIIEAYLNELKTTDIKDVQIIVPMKTRGVSAANALNETIRDIINPLKSYEFPLFVSKDKSFRTNDRVMQTVNDKERDVYNGDCGTVKGVYGSYLVVRFDDGKEVEYSVAQARELALAFAITIHKSQGSEYKTVITCFTMEHYIMLQRNLLYTAITRAKNKIIVFGETKAINMAISSVPANTRRTEFKRWLTS